MSYEPPAVSPNLVDAKGDLLVGTADNTVGRLAVGSTDGHVLKVKASASTGLEWGSTSSEQLIATISQNGNLVGNATSVGGRAYVKGAWTITQVRASLGYAPVTQSVIVDVNKNGTTLFSTQANRPTITTGSNTSAKTDMDVTSIADGDYLTVDVDQSDPFPTKPSVTEISSGSYSVASNGSVFVAVGSGGNLRSSTDGDTWTSRTSQFSTTDIHKVIYAGSQFVAVGASGKISTSSDGTTWVAQTSNTTNSITDIAHNGTNYVGVAGVDLVYSSDGTTWTKVTPGGTFYAVVPSGSNWVAAGSNILRTSSDAGLGTWTSRSLPATMTLHLAVANSSIVVVAGNSGMIATAPTSDLTTWTKRDVSGNTYDYGSSSAALGNRLGIWTGTAFVLSTNTAAATIYSYDGQTWYRSHGFQENSSASELAYGNGILYRGGGGHVHVSRDHGATWQRLPKPSSTNPSEMPAVYNATIGRWVYKMATSQYSYGASLLPASDLVVQVYGTPA